MNHAVPPWRSSAARASEAGWRTRRRAASTATMSSGSCKSGMPTTASGCTPAARAVRHTPRRKAFARAPGPISVFSSSACSSAKRGRSATKRLVSRSWYHSAGSSATRSAIALPPMAAHHGSPVCSCTATMPSTASAIGPVAAADATSPLSWRVRGRRPFGRASCGRVLARSARRPAAASIGLPTRRAEKRGQAAPCVSSSGLQR